MIIALYVKSRTRDVFEFKVAKVMPTGWNFTEYKEVLIRTYGSAWTQNNKVIPANSPSDLPDVLENLHVN